MSRYRIDTGKIRIIHNSFTVSETALHNKKRIFKGTTILYLGRVTLQKGPDYYLDIADKVLKVHPETRFILAGTGDAKANFTPFSALRLKNRFLFTAFSIGNRLKRIYRQQIFMFYLLFSEPFGISPLEAMAYGITAIISKQSGLPKLCIMLSR